MDFVAYLVATDGSLAGQEHRITLDGLTLGRAPDASLRLNDSGVSRYHALIRVHNAGVWVQDSGSRNGVFVNNKRVARPKQLGPGDTLRVGANKFVLDVRRRGEGELPDESVVRQRPLPTAQVTPPPPVPKRPGPARWVALAVLILAAIALLWTVGAI